MLRISSLIESSAILPRTMSISLFLKFKSNGNNNRDRQQCRCFERRDDIWIDRSGINYSSMKASIAVKAFAFPTMDSARVLVYFAVWSPSQIHAPRFLWEIGIRKIPNHRETISCSDIKVPLAYLLLDFGNTTITARITSSLSFLLIQSNESTFTNLHLRVEIERKILSR